MKSNNNCDVFRAIVNGWSTINFRNLVAGGIPVTQHAQPRTDPHRTYGSPSFGLPDARNPDFSKMTTGSTA